MEGHTTEKARLCLVEVREDGTAMTPCSAAERSEREVLVLRAGLQFSNIQ